MQYQILIQLFCVFCFVFICAAPLAGADPVTFLVGPDDSFQTIAEVFLDPAAVGDLNIILTGNTTDARDLIIPSERGLTSVTISGNDDYTIGNRTTLYANGVPIIFENGILDSLYGGGLNTVTENTSVTFKGGYISTLIGGGRATASGENASVTGTAMLVIDGVIDPGTYYIVGGGYPSAPNGGPVANADVSVGATDLRIINSVINDEYDITVYGGSALSSNVAGGPTGAVNSASILIDNSTLNATYGVNIYGGSYLHGYDYSEIYKLNGSVDQITLSVINNSSVYGWIFGGGTSDGNTTSVYGNISVSVQDSDVYEIIGGGMYRGTPVVDIQSIQIRLDNATLSGNNLIPGIWGNRRTAPNTRN